MNNRGVIMIPLNEMQPGNPRYQPKTTRTIFGYDFLCRPAVRVELATMQTLCELGVIQNQDSMLLTPQVIDNLYTIRTSEVDVVEKETNHDIRALVRVIQDRLPPPLKRWVHVPLTSYDVLDTARVLQLRQAYAALHPLIRLVMKELALRVQELAETVQIGRTHGQHALPITVGFWLASILSRLQNCAERFDEASARLRGKISGAVGAYNAQVALGIEERAQKQGASFETMVLARLKLQKAEVSTQILPPEHIAEFYFAALLLSGVLAQFGEDCRHLMRTEIGEVSEQFEAGQVGSSTMAHKRNPISFEQLVGMETKSIGAFIPILLTLVSEHQRDLTGSAPARDFPVILVNLAQQLESLTRRKKDQNGEERTFLKRMTFDQAACERNVRMQSHLVLAEPLYLALQMHGYEGDAHELINREIVPRAVLSRRPLFKELVEYGFENEQVRKAIDAMPLTLREQLSEASHYIGNSRKIALETAERALAYANR